jgi:hypothetical protein
MVRMKLTIRKHARAPSCRNDVPTEYHSDGQDVGYFPMTLWTVLLVLGASETLLFIETPRLLRGNSYLWRVCVVIYKRPMTDCIRCIRVTPTFCRNKTFCANRSTYKIIVLVKNFPKINLA